ncbi:MAG TPA: 16S rRNA (cytosine(967)-C(5))-methyltransferase RsmB [Gammaproteobacteria bacterium]|nr:16S rRNA (cytosine(967)-C(5))-methyltransferase RsmB [Gammaproteobacteria bacterium]
MQQVSKRGDARLLALAIIRRIIANGESLAVALPDALQPVVDTGVRARTQALCYGVLRGYGRFDGLLKLLLEHPLKSKDLDIRFLLMLGLYELSDARSPDYAVVSDIVGKAIALDKVWAKGLLNAVLRRFVRERQDLEKRLESDPCAYFSFPEWLLRCVREDWPLHWQTLLNASNRQAPMFLRVDINTIARDNYLERLRQCGIAAEPVPQVATAVRLLKPCEVDSLPGFGEGLVSVQDAAAQLAAPLLDPQPGERVLDACAAPGGKTLHLLQRQPHLDALVAVEVQAERLHRVRENLRRAALESKVELHVADVVRTPEWWDGRHFQRILLDVPCTASGVIRRHPDIKWLRREQDVDSLVEQQRKILAAVWPTLAPGGFLLYCTCSLLRRENERQIAWFLEQRPDALKIEIELPGGITCAHGVQIHSGQNDMDGFFYAALRKAP